MTLRKLEDITRLVNKLPNLPNIQGYIARLDPSIYNRLSKYIENYPKLYKNIQITDDINKLDNIISKLDDLKLTYLDDLIPQQLFKIDELLITGKIKNLDELKKFNNVDDLYKNIEELQIPGTFSKTTTPMEQRQVATATAGQTGANPGTVREQLQTAKKGELNQGGKTETENFLSSFQKGAMKTKDDVVKWIKANKLSAAMITLVTTLAVIASIRTQSINSTQFVITSITQNGDYIDIRYNDTITFAPGTTVNILSSNCLPSINGNYQMYKTTSGKFSIDGRKITSNGTYGTFTCVTTFGTELGNSVNTYVKNPTTEFSSGFLKQVTNYDSIAQFFSKNWWVFLLIFIFLFLSSVLSIFIRR